MSDAEYDVGTARLFQAKVQAQLLERLSRAISSSRVARIHPPRTPGTTTPRVAEPSVLEPPERLAARR
jgi:hypothetical protein